MSTSVMQVRVDDDLRAKAAAVYDELGIDLPTAIRMFLKRSVVVNGVPFSMTLFHRAVEAGKKGPTLLAGTCNMLAMMRLLLQGSDSGVIVACIQR